MGITFKHCCNNSFHTSSPLAENRQHFFFIHTRTIIHHVPTIMLITLAIILIVLWLIGVIAFPVIGWFIHILLVLAIIMLLVRVIQGRNPIQ